MSRWRQQAVKEIKGVWTGSRSERAADALVGGTPLAWVDDLQALLPGRSKSALIAPIKARPAREQLCHPSLPKTSIRLTHQRPPHKDQSISKMASPP